MKKLIKDGLILILIMGVIFFIGFLAINKVINEPVKKSL